MIIFLLTVHVLSLGFRILFNKSPISLGMWILILSLFISILVRAFYFSWFGFIIFLIYIGGILVIFSYFVAIQPNQYIRLKKPILFFVLSFINLPINVYPVLTDLYIIQSWWVSSIFYLINIWILLILGFVLFLALIRVVKITIVNIAPLRPYLI